MTMEDVNSQIRMEKLRGTRTAKTAIITITTQVKPMSIQMMNKQRMMLCFVADILRS